MRLVLDVRSAARPDAVVCRVNGKDLAGGQSTVVDAGQGEYRVSYPVDAPPLRQGMNTVVLASRLTSQAGGRSARKPARDGCLGAVSRRAAGGRLPIGVMDRRARMPATLNTRQLAARFQEDGFVVVKGFLNAEELKRTEQEIDRYITEVLPTVPRIHVVYEAGWSGPLKQFSRMELYDEYFRQALQRPATLDLLGACLGEPVEPITTEVFYKPARVGSPALYH